MSNHCKSCDGWMPSEYREKHPENPDCPGCPECEKMRAELESERKESAYWRNTEAPILAQDNIALREACEQLRARLALAERLCNAVARCEEGRGRFGTAPLHDCRCEKDRKISDVCTCGGDEYQEALAAWEEEKT